MDQRDIIVIGASAGGVEALRELAAGLPADFPAAIFAVIHFPPYGTSFLPEILTRSGALPARHPKDGDAVTPGTICVAPPDRHLLLEPGVVQLSPGPRENGHRPAADPLFRTAARAYGRRVIGVVLTGNLDDGTAGLAAVARRGGVTVVQDPADAAHPGMPSSALANVRVDHAVPLAEMAALLQRLVAEPVPAPREERVGDELDFEADIAEMEPYALHADIRPGRPSGFSCPECHGVLWEIQDGELVRFRCRVGHAFGPETLLAEQTQEVETALWTAFQALKERAAFARKMAKKMESRGNEFSRRRFMDQAAEADQRASVIREVLRGGGRQTIPQQVANAGEGMD
ncbi:chemotaxis protein CheB [Longimicrobium sp.]|uniref:chemotaxis protein CheB n=1 Tax=Longimicrobium sp. TaxID=2029185 RepID=UPI002B766665|nr:chemotaxis protein CheB [Longimicrobium sp.]HSU14813.1 chemotaxis protein CheB [Longimicrobium sp.]